MCTKAISVNSGELNCTIPSQHQQALPHSASLQPRPSSAGIPAPMPRSARRQAACREQRSSPCSRHIRQRESAHQLPALFFLLWLRALLPTALVWAQCPSLLPPFFFWQNTSVVALAKCLGKWCETYSKLLASGFRVPVFGMAWYACISLEKSLMLESALSRDGSASRSRWKSPTRSDLHSQKQTT